MRVWIQYLRLKVIAFIEAILSFIEGPETLRGIESSTFAEQISNLIKSHEGFSGLPYLDNLGNWTLGYGRNLDSEGLTGKEFSVVLTNPITVVQAEYLLNNDIDATMAWLSNYIWWSNLTNNRKLSMIDMGFNLGQSRFEQFTHMISALADSDYTEAAAQMKNSLWYSEVTSRAEDDIMLMLTG